VANEDVSQAIVVIGRIYTPFKDPAHLPIQGTATDARGTVALLPQYAGGLADLDGFDRVWLLYLRPRGGPAELTVVPRLDEKPHGVFATRSPQRPSAIGLSCVRLLEVTGDTLQVAGVDMLDDLPLIDIKPYVPRLDSHPDSWAGWLENRFPGLRAWKPEKG
jgi:tRNA-Thr(GGU) m(6)t(6)A37 methyltransferase TsaA